MDRRISTSTFRGGVVGPHYAVPTRRQKGHLHSRGAAISHEITKACHAEAGDGAKRRVRGLSQRLTVYSRSNYQVTFSGMQKQRPTQLHKNGAGIMAVWLAWLPKVSAYWSKDGKWILGKEVEHWHDGHLGEFYKKPREKFGELASEFGKAFKHSPEHKHPLAPPWWQFVIMFTLVVVALIGCIIWKVMADAERRFVEGAWNRVFARERPCVWCCEREGYCACLCLFLSVFASFVHEQASACSRGRAMCMRVSVRCGARVGNTRGPV